MSLSPSDLDRVWTFADLQSLPDDGHRYEIVDGNLLVTPSPPQVHQIWGGGLRDQLFLAAPAGWRCGTAMAVPLGADHVRVPDVVVHRWPPAHPRDDVRNPVGPLDVGLVVEVVSPRSRRTDRFAKPGEYADAGIPIFWRLETDPTLVLHSFVLGADGYRPEQVLAARGRLRVPWGSLDVDLGLLDR